MSNSRPKVFISRPIPLAKELLSSYFDVEENSQDESVSRDKLKEVAAGCDAILGTTAEKYDKEILQAAKKLRVISNYAIGLDNIDLVLAKQIGITIYNVPDVVTNSTADLTFAIFLSLIRRIPEASAYVRNKKWIRWRIKAFLGEELVNKTFGIIGFGRIGKAVARRALGFGLNIIVYNHSPITPEEGVQQVSLDDLFARSDYISLHVPLNPETKDLINLSVFKKMAKKPVLINASRGGLVNTDDLVTALKTGLIRACALDVTAPEPIPVDHPLLQIENCLIVPHIGTSTIDCRENMAKKSL